MVNESEPIVLLLLFLTSALIVFLPFKLNYKISLAITAITSIFVFVFSWLSFWAEILPVYIYNISSFITLEFSLNKLSSFFILIISFSTFVNSIYSIGYLKSISNRSAIIFFYNIFILSMIFVLMSNNIFSFLIFWELMSVASYFLVTIEGDRESARAGLLYIVMSHIGTAFIISSFFLFYKYVGDISFSAWGPNIPVIPENIKITIFLLSFLGFGIKAGIVPFHSWLPYAHPQAPSNVSALMSGVMIKLGIFGMIKFTYPLFDKPPLFLGVIVLIIGSISALLGILYAFMEKDIKRLLAFSSIENIGIILLGFSVSLIFKSFNFVELSFLALVASILHLLNHSIFKNLLFMAAGSLVHLTHTRNMEKMGGLAKLLPKTSTFFLVGIVSICAFPPFNGFIGEWLTYQSLLSGFGLPSVSAKIFLPISGIALALTGSVAAATFAKLYGIAFLGARREPYLQVKKEDSLAINIACYLLCLLCLLLGVFPQVALGIIGPLVNMITSHNISIDSLNIYTISFSQGTSIMPAVSFILLLIIGLLVFTFVSIMTRKNKVSYGDAWDCGIPSLTERMQYTAEAFTKPLKLIFKKVYLPKRDVKLEYQLKPLFVKSIRYAGDIEPFFEKYLFIPLLKKGKEYTLKLRVIQSGSLHLYLAYILITLILLLIFGL